ncbi:MAG: hypothetical protein JRE58_05795 [Deltaproteobacteria bacterium]|nr:hypothetical protein [Deltaproteobacteria bacterium]
MILNREIPTELSHEADARWREFCNALDSADPALTAWTDTVRLLETLARCHVMDPKTALYLKETYLIYRSAVHRCNLQEKPTRVPQKEFDGQSKKVEEIRRYFLD